MQFFLPAIIILGIITSYQDIKSGKIRNKWIIIGLAYALITNIALITYYSLTTSINTQYLLELTTNFIISILIGYAMWHYNIWSAADGKLFIAFSSLLPLEIYAFGHQKYFPAITLLTNIFLVSIMIMGIALFFKIKQKTIMKIAKTFAKENLNIKQLSTSALTIFSIFWLIQLLLAFFKMRNYLLTFAFTMILIPLIQKKTGKYFTSMLWIIAGIRILSDKTIYTKEFLLNFIILILIWRIIYSLIFGSVSKLSQEIFSRKIKIDELTPGMILSEKIDKKKITKKELAMMKKQTDTELIKQDDYYFIKTSKTGFDNGMINEAAEGLNKTQIREIKKMGFKKIKISQTIPFAPLIFAGVVLTILAKGNILIYIKNLF